MSRSKRISFENRDKYIALGLNISYYRKLRGYTQEQLAERADLSRSYLSSVEAPSMITNVSLEVLFNLAKALDVSPAQLLEMRK